MDVNSGMSQREVSTLEKWALLKSRLTFHIARQPDMDTKEGPRRWAQLLFEWSCEAVALAYGRENMRTKIRELADDYFVGK